jgi:HSP20 family molecular chaperone IbpA
MQLSLATLTLSFITTVSAYNVGGFDMFGRPVIVTPRVFGRNGRGGPCWPGTSSSGGPSCGPGTSSGGRARRNIDSVDRAFEDLTNELNEDGFRRRRRQGRQGGSSSSPWVNSVIPPQMRMDEDTIRQQEEWVSRAFGIASDVAKGMASSPREIKEADEALRQQKEWVDRVFGFAKDVSSGGTYSPSVRSEVLQDDEKAFEVALDVPGVKASDIDVTVEGTKTKVLMIRGKREVGNKDGDGVVRTKNFSKEFVLDPNSDVDQISASLDNGVLLVSIPRTVTETTETTQTIPVSTVLADDSTPSSDNTQTTTTDDQPFQLEVDVPGVTAANVNIVVEGETDKILSITAVREMGKDSEGKPRTKEFSKSFKIDELIDTEKIVATLSNGVLTISAPKDEKKVEESVRKIMVNSQAPDASSYPPASPATYGDSAASSNEEDGESDAA